MQSTGSSDSDVTHNYYSYSYSTFVWISFYPRALCCSIICEVQWMNGESSLDMAGLAVHCWPVWFAFDIGLTGRRSRVSTRWTAQLAVGGYSIVPAKDREEKSHYKLLQFPNCQSAVWGIFKRKDADVLWKSWRPKTNHHIQNHKHGHIISLRAFLSHL